MNNADKKVLELKSLVEGAEVSLQQARKILEALTGDEGAMLADQAKRLGSVSTNADGQVIEGLFDGQNMLGPDGKRYSVPANYASKSKLVEGDGLKLTIMPDGSFVYKQINLLERDRLVGSLAIDEKTDEYRVVANGKAYKVLTASITYYKGEPGDNVTILVPKGKETSWAAVENIFKPGEEIPGVAPSVNLSAETKREDKKEFLDPSGVSEPSPTPETNEFLSSELTKATDTETLEPNAPTEPAGLYGPTAPSESQPTTQGDSFLSEEAAQGDSWEEKSQPGLEEI